MSSKNSSMRLQHIFVFLQKCETEKFSSSAMLERNFFQQPVFPAIKHNTHDLLLRTSFSRETISTNYQNPSLCCTLTTRGVQQSLIVSHFHNQSILSQLKHFPCSSSLPSICKHVIQAMKFESKFRWMGQGRSPTPPYQRSESQDPSS